MKIFTYLKTSLVSLCLFFGAQTVAAESHNPETECEQTTELRGVFFYGGFGTMALQMVQDEELGFLKPYCLELDIVVLTSYMDASRALYETADRTLVDGTVVEAKYDFVESGYIIEPLFQRADEFGGVDTVFTAFGTSVSSMNSVVAQPNAPDNLSGTVVATGRCMCQNMTDFPNCAEAESEREPLSVTTAMFVDYLQRTKGDPSVQLLCGKAVPDQQTLGNNIFMRNYVKTSSARKGVVRGEATTGMINYRDQQGMVKEGLVVLAEPHELLSLPISGLFTLSDSRFDELEKLGHALNDVFTWVNENPVEAGEWLLKQSQEVHLLGKYETAEDAQKAMTYIGKHIYNSKHQGCVPEAVIENFDRLVRRFGALTPVGLADCSK